MNRYFNIVWNDLRNIRRDPLLIFMIIYPWMFAIIIRFAVPPLQEYYRGMFDLKLYYPVVLVFLGLIVPAMLGAAQSFIFLDDRDDRTLEAIRVTPLPMWVYFAIRFSVTVTGGFVIIMVIIPLSGLMTVEWLGLVPIALEAALVAPFFALMISSIARNKVEGFAVIKATGFFALIPAISFFVPGYWNYLFAPIPLYWPAMALYTLLDVDGGWYSGYWFYVVGGTSYTVMITWLLYRRFRRVVG